MGGEHQIHRQNSEREDHHCKGTRLHFFPGDTGPVKTEALRVHAFEDPLHGIDGLTGTAARSWRAFNFDRPVKIEMRHHRGAIGFPDGEKFRQRNQITCGTFHVNSGQTLRCGSTFCIGLHVDTTHLAFLKGVVHIQTAEIDAESLHRRSEVHLDRGHPIPVDLDLDLG